MESPAKRRRINQSEESDEDGNSFLQPQADFSRRDSDYQLHVKRAVADNRFQSTMAHIFEKYGRDFEGVGDEIDMMTGEIVVNNGHLKNMRDEGDVGVGQADDEEAENGGMRLEDLLDEDQFLTTDEEESEYDQEEHGDRNEEINGNVEERIPHESHKPASTKAASHRHSESSLPELLYPGSLEPVHTMGINPLFGSGIRPGASTLDFGESPLSFGHSPLAFNPWSQHMPQQVMWDTPEIPQHRATANRNALQPRQQRRSRAPVPSTTSIWTSGTLYEAQLRARRSFQRRSHTHTSTTTKPRFGRRHQTSNPPSSTAYDSNDMLEDSNLTDRGQQTRPAFHRIQPEIRDSDGEGLPSPPRRKPLRESKNQGNDKSPEQRASSWRKAQAQSRKRKLNAGDDGRAGTISVELAVRSRTPSSSNVSEKEPGQANDGVVSTRGRFGREVKPVQHFSQMTWPVSRQGKWRTERQAAAREAAQQAAAEQGLASASENEASGFESQKGAALRSARGTKTNSSSLNTITGKEKVIPDSQDSLTPPTSSLPRVESIRRRSSALETKDTDFTNAGYMLSDDEMPMQVLPSRAFHSAQTFKSRDGDPNEQTKRKRTRRVQRNSMPDVLEPENAEEPDVSRGEEWLLVKTTKRKPYYRRNTRTSIYDDWVLIQTTKRKPYYRRIARKRESMPGFSVRDPSLEHESAMPEEVDDMPETQSASEAITAGGKEGTVSGTTSASNIEVGRRRSTRFTKGGESEMMGAQDIIDQLPKGRREIRWLLTYNGEGTSESDDAESLVAEEINAEGQLSGGVSNSREEVAEVDSVPAEEHTYAKESASSAEAASEPHESDKAQSLEMSGVQGQQPVSTLAEETTHPMGDSLAIVEEIEAVAAKEAGSEVAERDNTPSSEVTGVQAKESAMSAEEIALLAEKSQLMSNGKMVHTEETQPADEDTMLAAGDMTSVVQKLSSEPQKEATSLIVHSPEKSTSPVVDETDQDDFEPSSAPLRLGSPELGSPSRDPYDLPPSPAARPRLSPAKTTATSPAKPSPLRKTHIPSGRDDPSPSRRKSASPTKPVSPSKITKSTAPRTPRSINGSSPRKNRTPSSRRSLLSLSQNKDEDDFDELAAVETPGVRTVASVATKRRSSVSRRIWKSTPRTTEVATHPAVRLENGKPGSDNGFLGDMIRTPGGTLRTCGVDGFMCGRDFCFVCL